MCLASKYLHLHIFILIAQTHNRLHLHFMIFQLNASKWMHHLFVRLLNKFDPIDSNERYETQKIKFDIMSTSGFSSFIETHFPFWFNGGWKKKNVSHAETKLFGFFSIQTKFQSVWWERILWGYIKKNILKSLYR